MSYNKSLFKQLVEESKKKKSLPKPKDKILDPMGQWKFPGQVTRIPSNRITMQGVPYPVKGVGSSGQEQMMYSGQEYSFPDSTYVDEYPLVKAQKGLTFLEPNSQKLPANNNRSELATSIGGENGEPAFLVPSFKYGRPILGPSNNLYDEFYRTGEHLGGPFKTWQEADEWGRNVRHPYVEKGQSIPIPIRRWGRDYNNQSSGERNSFFFKNGGDVSIPNLEEGGWLNRYDVGGTAEKPKPKPKPKDKLPVNPNDYRKFLIDFQNSQMGRQMLEASVNKDDPWGSNSSHAEAIRDARNLLTRNAKVNILDFSQYKKNLIQEFGPNDDDAATTTRNSGIGGWASQYDPVTGEPLSTFNFVKSLKNPFNILNILNSSPTSLSYAKAASINPESSSHIEMHGEGDVHDLPGNIVHELSHASDKSGVFIPRSDQNLMRRYSGTALKKVGDKYVEPIVDPWAGYVSKPTETRARLMDFRFNAKKQGVYDPFTQKITLDLLKKYKPSSSLYEPLYQLQDIYSDEEIVDMLNKVSKTQTPNNTVASNMAYHEGQLPKFQTAGQNDFFNRMMKRASANQYNNAPSFSDVQDRGVSANVKASYQPQIKKQQALTTIQKKTGVNRNIAGMLDYLQTSPGSTATISQGRQRTQRDEEERKRRNYEYAMNNGLLYNHNTGDVANPNDKGATGGGWGRVEAPELAQTFAGMSGSGNIGAGRIGAEMFTNMNPITAPITSAGRLTQQVLGQNPYGFNNNGFISNILPALGVAGDIAGVSSFKLLPGSQRVINQGNRILNYGNRSYGPGQTPVLRASMVPSGKQVKKVIDNINQKTNNAINWLGDELTGANTVDYTGKSGKNYKIEYRNSNNLGKDLEFKRFFDISHADDASQHFGFTISKPKGKIASLDDLAFFNNDPDAANEQLGLFLRGIENSALTIPLTKINNRGMMPFGSQNLSMYSQPMMNMHASRLARQMGQSGPRLQLLYDNTAPLKELNSSIRTAPGSSTFRDQLLEMWPKIESSYKLLQQNTGIKMKRPRLLYNDFEDMFNFGQTNDINVDMLKQSKYRGLQPGNVNMLVPEYGIIKNYKQGGQINWLDKYK
jgi:hypothetical protein